MAGVTTNTVALVALLSMLATSARSGVTYSSTWLPAKATWYGKPNGAGPDNNGTLICHCHGGEWSANSEVI
jgi:hypothetical protein